MSKYLKGLGEITPVGGSIRDPYPTEDEYFKNSPKVAGMATEDNKVILNPYSTLSREEYQSVANNEAARIVMRDEKFTPNFDLSEEQISNLKGTTYENSDDISRKSTIAARIVSGDPSGGKPTKQQQEYVSKLQDELARRNHMNNKVAYAQKVMADDPTKYMTGEEIDAWDKQARISKGLGPDYDYGMESTADNRGHLGDIGKLPNHPTFSDQSAYSGKVNGLTGGAWNGNTFTPASWQQTNESAAIRQWLINNKRNDGDVYIGPNGQPIVQGK